MKFDERLVQYASPEPRFGKQHTQLGGERPRQQIERALGCHEAVCGPLIVETSKRGLPSENARLCKPRGGTSGHASRIVISDPIDSIGVPSSRITLRQTRGSDVRNAPLDLKGDRRRRGGPALGVQRFCNPLMHFLQGSVPASSEKSLANGMMNEP